MSLHYNNLVLDPPYFKRLARPDVVTMTSEEFLAICRLERELRGLPNLPDGATEEKQYSALVLWLFLDFLKRWQAHKSKNGGAA